MCCETRHKLHGHRKGRIHNTLFAHPADLRRAAEHALNLGQDQDTYKRTQVKSWDISRMLTPFSEGTTELPLQPSRN